MAISKAGKQRQKQLYSAMVGSDTVDKNPSTIELQVSELPAIRDWKVGETYTIQVEAKMRSMSEGGYDGKQPLSATFEVTGAKEISDSESANQ